MTIQSFLRARAILYALAVIAIFGVCAQKNSAHAQSETAAATVMLILDGSGSMWGKLGTGEQTKLGLSQKLLIDALAKPNPKLNLGFASFGHRRAGNCSDAQVVVPPGPATLDDVRQRIAKLNPRGKGPLSLALQKAAASIDPSVSSSIVLIHDGYDNCRQDPCKTADEIASSHPNLAIQLVSLDLPESTTSAMSCVAKKTGGKAYVVRNEAEFRTAMQSAMAITMLRPPKAAKRLTDKPSPGSGQQAAAKTGPPRVRLVAGFKTDAGQRIRDVTWRIVSPADLQNVLIEKRTTEFAEPIPPGRYIVRATAGLAQAEQQITVREKGETRARVILNAGVLTFTHSAQQNVGAETVDPMFLSLRGQSDDAAPNDERPIWIGAAKKTDQLIVPTGRYALNVERGAISKTVDVHVASGKVTDINTDLDGGLLILDSKTGAAPQTSQTVQTGPAVPAPLQTLIKNVAYTITTDDPSAPGGRREVSRSASPHAKFQLPPGTFYAEAQLGEAKRERRFAIGGGQVVRHEFRFDVAQVRLDARLGTRAVPKTTPVSFKAYPLSQSPRSSAIRFNKRNANLVLPTGRYRFEAEVAGKVHGKSPAMDVRPGSSQTITISLDAGELSLKPTLPTVRGFSATNRYQVRDSSGVIVWRGRADRPISTLLPPGSYALEKRSNPSQKQNFEVRVGENTSIELDTAP